MMGDLLAGLVKYWPLLFLLIQIVIGWALWRLGERFVSRDSCDRCRADQAGKQATAERQTGEQARKLSALELAGGSYPTRGEMKDLSNKIEKLVEKLGHLDGRLTGVNRAVDLLNQHHLRVNG